MCCITIESRRRNNKLIFFLNTFRLSWDSGYTWVYRISMSNLFIHEHMKEVFCKVNIIFFQLGIVQIHTPCNKKWKISHTQQ